MALNYVCSNANIDGVLLGVDTVSQLQNNLSCISDDKFKDIIENIDSINIDLSAEVLEEINIIHNENPNRFFEFDHFPNSVEKFYWLF